MPIVFICSNILSVVGEDTLFNALIVSILSFFLSSLFWQISVMVSVKFAKLQEILFGRLHSGSLTHYTSMVSEDVTSLL